MESILTSIKKLLGIEKEYEHFDMELVMHINTVFADLTQIGVGPKEGFSIEDETSTWDEFISDLNTLAGVKSYMYLRVRLLFDPPAHSFVLESMNRQIEKLECRLNYAADTPSTDNTETNQNGSVKLTDVKTGEAHELYVDNGDLKMS